MYKFQLKPSLFLYHFNLGLFCLSLLILLLYHSMSYISVMSCVLVILLMINEYNNFHSSTRRAKEILTINTATEIIEWKSVENNHQFSDYSVYTCRWGMILVLKQSKFRKSLILLADRFDNNRDYLDLRFHLIRLNQAINAS